MESDLSNDEGELTTRAKSHFYMGRKNTLAQRTYPDVEEDIRGRYEE